MIQADLSQQDKKARQQAETAAARDALAAMLRGMAMGGAFRPGAPLGPYVLDFAAPELRAAILLEGAMPENVSPALQARYFEEKGYRVLRFTNRDVLGAPDAVRESLMNMIRSVVESTPVAETTPVAVAIKPEDKAPAGNASGMDKIRVVGGVPLYGEIAVSGAKNAALKLMCAALLTEKSVFFENAPNGLRDIQSQADLMAHLGVTLRREGALMAINAKGIHTVTAPYELVRKMRTSILVLGPLLARFGEAKVSLPGGCAIGTRPVDLHLKGLEEMGARIVLEGGYIDAKAPAGGLVGAKILFPKVSVGATENLMMAATLARGETVLANAAREPEIVDLGECLIAMGAKISGLGTDTIRIEGVQSLHGAKHTILPDRIEAGTYMVAAAMTGGRVRLKNARAEHLTAAIALLKQAGVGVEDEDGDIVISRDPDVPLRGVDFQTEPYPGFPTDLQAQFMAMLCLAEGAGMVTETIFENRFMHVPELCRMGANITVHGSSAIVRGVARLKGAEVMATDLRASVALVLAGLVAEGETVVNRIYHLERGYENIVGKLAACGAEIERVGGE